MIYIGAIGFAWYKGSQVREQMMIQIVQDKLRDNAVEIGIARWFIQVIKELIDIYIYRVTEYCVPQSNHFFHHLTTPNPGSFMDP